MGRLYGEPLPLPSAAGELEVNFSGASLALTTAVVVTEGTSTTRLITAPRLQWRGHSHHAKRTRVAQNDRQR